MIQLTMFEPLPRHIIQIEWLKENIKNPPPLNVTEEQRKQAQAKLENMKQVKINKINLS